MLTLLDRNNFLVLVVATITRRRTTKAQKNLGFVPRDHLASVGVSTPRTPVTSWTKRPKVTRA